MKPKWGEELLFFSTNNGFFTASYACYRRRVGNEWLERGSQNLMPIASDEANLWLSSGSVELLDDRFFPLTQNETSIDEEGSHQNRGKPIAIACGDMSFPSKTSTYQYFQGVAKRYRRGRAIPEPDHSRIMDLFKRHPNYRAKTLGRTIHHFEGGPNIEDTRSLWVVFTDGYRVDFSIGKCLGWGLTERRANLGERYDGNEF